MTTAQDDAAIKAALTRTGCRIKTTAQYPVSDAAGDFILRGAFLVNAASTESVRIQLTDGDTEFVRIEIEHDGTGTPTWTQDGAQTITAQRLFLSGEGTIWNFALDCTLTAPTEPTWYLEIDPYITAGAVGDGVDFEYLVIDAKV